MNVKKIFPILLVLFGEALLIICITHFGRNLDQKILILNIVVFSIIYSLFFIDFFSPMIDFKDKSNKTAGSLGIRWFFRFLYMILAIGAIAIFNLVKPIDFNSQIIIQGILFFMLLLGLYFAFASSQKVHQVFIDEEQHHNTLEEMKKATKEIQNKFDQIKNIPVEIVTRISVLQENLRFISACNNQEAYTLETNYLNEIKTIQNNLFEVPLNYDKIIENIQNCERAYKERKQIFSN